MIKSEAATLDKFASSGEYSASEEAIFRSAANEIRELRRDVDALVLAGCHWTDAEPERERLEAELASALSELQGVKEALEFYAIKANWGSPAYEPEDTACDLGARARQALAAQQPSPEGENE